MGPNSLPLSLHFRSDCQNVKTDLEIVTEVAVVANEDTVVSYVHVVQTKR